MYGILNRQEMYIGKECVNDVAPNSLSNVILGLTTTAKILSMLSSLLQLGDSHLVH